MKCCETVAYVPSAIVQLVLVSIYEVVFVSSCQICKLLGERALLC